MHIQWTGLLGTTYVYVVRYRPLVDPSVIADTSTLILNSLYKSANASTQTLFQVGQVIELLLEWSIFDVAISATAAVKEVRIQNLKPDTYYEFQVLAYANGAAVQSAVVIKNTANTGQSTVSERFRCSE
jgi:hypothetical protein